MLMSGELGTGKTELIRVISSHLGITGTRSPSFTLVNEYHGRLPVAHGDLYRLRPEEVEELELEEYLAQRFLLLVEWAERWEDPPDTDVWRIFLEFGGEEGSDPFNAPRECRIQCSGARACEALGKAVAAMPQLCRDHSSREADEHNGTHTRY